MSLEPGDGARLLATRHEPAALGRWNLRELDVHPRYAAALCTEGAVPDLRVEVVDCFAQGEIAGSSWVATATHRGEFLGVAATGRATRTTGLAMSSWRDGVCVESWIECLAVPATYAAN